MVIYFNYYQHHQYWILFKMQPKNRSFLWGSILRCLLAFRKCITHIIHDGRSTHFWLNDQLGGRVPRDLQPETFVESTVTSGTVNALALNFLHILREINPFIDNFLLNLNGDSKDLKRWNHTSNGTFQVKSFYNFLIDGGLRCQSSMNISRVFYSRKVKAFTWLAWDNKILTLEDLAKRRCIKLPTAICILCFNDIESSHHLFIQRPFIV